MNRDTVIVFCATFIGLLTSIFTFNQLLELKILPSRVSQLAELQVQPIEASTATTKLEVQQITPTISVQNSTELGNIVQKALVGSTGRYAVAIKNLKTGEVYNKDENEIFASASLYKLWVMGTTYEQIKQGKVKEDESMTEDIPTLNAQFDIASESAEQTTGTVSMSVATALSQMITISHNYAALLLTAKVKLSSIDAYLKEHQITNSSTGVPPKTTAADTLEFFEKLYKGDLADPDSTTKMLTLLKQQRLNQKLPKYLPEETVIAHKTGELDGVSHDAGIVYTNKGDYIIVILSDSNDPKGASERLANISKVVYGYFTK